MKVLEPGKVRKPRNPWPRKQTCRDCRAKLEVEQSDLYDIDEGLPVVNGRIRFNCGFCGKPQKLRVLR